jgi:hypothetical protein
MKTVASYIRKVANESGIAFWADKIKDRYGLDTELGPKVVKGHCIFREITHILEPIPPDLIKDCGINHLLIRNDMGPNKPYYPNHGYFTGSQIALNADIFYNPDLPDDFFDHHGYFITRPQQTLIHEFGHGYDQHHGNLSLRKNWLKLSNWSENFKPGLKRLIIDEKEAPKIVGEWFYNPNAEFTRFYAKRNPWDDWADSFAFYTAGLRNKVPSKKAGYFKNTLKTYYS